MAKNFIIIITILFVQTSIAQVKQGTLIDDAKYFKRIHQYKKSLALFQQALQTQSNISDDYYYAVNVALLNKNTRLAFQWLNDYAKIDNYRCIKDITSDSDLFVLHFDKRWKDFILNLENRNLQREATYDQTLKKELDQLYFDDQDIRIKYLDAFDKLGPKNKILDSLTNQMAIIDSINLIKVSDILDKHGWLKSSEVGEKGNTALFGVIQHADLKTQQKYDPLIEKAFREGDMPAILYSEFIDRVRLREGSKQLYGTQYAWKPNSKELYVLPLEDPDNIDKRRLLIGLGHFAYFLQGQDIKWNLKDYKKNEKQYEKWNADVQ